MSASFDPYYKWLGIPPAEQPPNYYRLLGINLFETHLDAIESAADQRMVHLRSFQTGQQATASQKLLNEVAAAKLCLLKPEKKAAYDDKLRARLVGHGAPSNQPLRAAAPEAAKSAPAAVSSPAADWQADAMTFTGTTNRRKTAGAKARKSSPPMLFLVGGPIAGIAVVVGIFVVLNNRQDGARQADPNRSSPQIAAATPPSRDKHEDKHAALSSTNDGKANGAATTTTLSPKSSVQPPDKNELKQPAPNSGLATPSADKVDTAPKNAAPQDAVSQSADPAGTNVAKTDVAKNDPANPDATAADPAKSDEAKPAPEPRVAVPDEAAQQRALQQVKDILKEDYAQAKNAEGQLALARKLQKLGVETKNDPASRYVTFSQALEFAAKGGDAALAIESIDALGKAFELDVWDLRQKTLTQLARGAKSLDARSAIAKTALDLADQALPQNRFDTAIVLTAIATNLAAATKDNALRDQARELSERTKRLQKEQPAVVLAGQKLKTSPDDAEANLAVGRFKCLLLDDWKEGLPYLVKGSDDALKTLAKQELADPTAAEDQSKLADGWWDLTEKKGERKDDPIIKSMRARAMVWYRLALPNLSGLTLAKVQKRIDAEEASRPEAPVTETAYLDDLTEQNLTLANASLGKHGGTGYERNFGNFGPRGGGRGRGPGGMQAAAAALAALNAPQKVALGGVEAKHALSLMPKSNGSATVAYNLDGKYRLFTGTAAIIDGDNPQAAVIFRVLADGKPLWVSRPMRRAGDAQECSLRISKVQSLQFEILCNGANTGAHTAWINPAVGR